MLNPYVKGHSEIRQRLIVPDLALKGRSAREIHHNLETILEPDAIEYSPVTRSPRETRFPPSSAESASVDVLRGVDDSD
jgi:hypothetical protein